MAIITPFLDIASKMCTVKTTETVLPIAKKVCYVNPLLVGDDLELRSSLTSPVGYDRSLIQLLYKHTLISEETGNVKPEFTKFCTELSNFDKLSLIWALYKSTYETLARQKKIKCTNKAIGCQNEITTDINLDELIHDDTYTPWDEVDAEGNEISFTAFRYPVHITFNDIVYSFNTRLPSIQDNNIMLGAISTDVLQKNLDTIGSVFTRPQQMCLLVDAMRIASSNNSFEPVETTNPQEIMLTLQSYIPFTVAEEFFKQYNEKFDKYVPKFYKEVTCPVCGHVFNHNVDLEIEFFRRSVRL